MQVIAVGLILTAILALSVAWMGTGTLYDEHDEGFDFIKVRLDEGTVLDEITMHLEYYDPIWVEAFKVKAEELG